jgi:hypothetical protein
MATTTAIVEILVIGIVGSIWVIFFITGIFALPLDALVHFMLKLNDWSGLITFLLIGILYQLGWLINGFSYGILRLFLEKRIRSNIFSQKKLEYRKVRALVYQKASDKVREDLNVERSVIRLSRSGIFNFFLVSTALLINGSTFIKFVPISLVLFAGCGVQWYFRFIRYYNRMIDEYDVIKA